MNCSRKEKEAALEREMNLEEEKLWAQVRYQNIHKLLFLLFENFTVVRDWNNGLNQQCAAGPNRPFFMGLQLLLCTLKLFPLINSKKIGSDSLLKFFAS